MIRINLDDGTTIKLDLAKPGDRKSLKRLLANPGFQNKITAITVMKKYQRKRRCPQCKGAADLICPKCGKVHDDGQIHYMGNQLAMIRPESFDSVCFETTGEDGSEKIVCYAGDVRLVIMAYDSQPTSRITLRRIGRRRFVPEN